MNATITDRKKQTREKKERKQNCMRLNCTSANTIDDGGGDIVELYGVATSTVVRHQQMADIEPRVRDIMRVTYNTEASVSFWLMGKGFHPRYLCLVSKL